MTSDRDDAAPAAPLSGIFSVDGVRHLVTLTPTSISCAPVPSSKFPQPPPEEFRNPCADSSSSINHSQLVNHSLSDVCVVVRAGPRSFTLHSLDPPSDPSLPRPYSRHDFALVSPSSLSAPSDEPVTPWIREISRLMNRGLSLLPPVLVVLNPFSGTHRAESVWESECAPLLNSAGLKFRCVMTKKAGEAYEILKSLRLGDHSSVACVGGDGVLNECINGLMAREDWEEAMRRTPLVTIAAGTGNAVTHGLYGTLNPACACCHLIRGVTGRMDIFMAAQPSLRQYVWGCLGASYGIVAEADFGSEKVRWLGSLRPSVWAFYRIMCGSMYRCKLTYLPCDMPRQSWYGVKCGKECQVCQSQIRRSEDASAAEDYIDSAPVAPSTSVPLLEPKPMRAEAVQREQEQSAYGPPFTMSTTPTDEWEDDVPAKFSKLLDFPRYRLGQSTPPAGWAQHDNLSVSFCTFQKMPWLMPGMLVAPYSHHLDGCMDISYATAESFSRVSFMKFFGSFADGAHLSHPKCNYLKVRSFTIEPLDQDGYLGVDGERIHFGPVQFYVAQGLLRTLCYV